MCFSSYSNILGRHYQLFCSGLDWVIVAGGIPDGGDESNHIFQENQLSPRHTQDPNLEQGTGVAGGGGYSGDEKGFARRMSLGLGWAVAGWLWGQLTECCLHQQGWLSSQVQLSPGECVGSSLLLLIWLWRHSQRYGLLQKLPPSWKYFLRPPNPLLSPSETWRE